MLLKHLIESLPDPPACPPVTPECPPTPPVKDCKPEPECPPTPPVKDCAPEPECPPTPPVKDCKPEPECPPKECPPKDDDECDERSGKWEKEHAKYDKCDEEPVCKNPCDDGGDTCDLQAALATLSNSEIVDYGISQLSDGPTELAALDIADTPLDLLGA